MVNKVFQFHQDFLRFKYMSLRKGKIEKNGKGPDFLFCTLATISAILLGCT